MLNYIKSLTLLAVIGSVASAQDRGAIQLFALTVEQASADARVARRPDHSRRQDDERQVASDAAAADE